MWTVEIYFLTVIGAENSKVKLNADSMTREEPLSVSREDCFQCTSTCQKRGGSLPGLFCKCTLLPWRICLWLNHIPRPHLLRPSPSRFRFQHMNNSEGPAHAQYRNRGIHTCPFPGRAPCMRGAGAKWEPTAIWGPFYMSLIFVCLIYVENIFSHLSFTITSLVSFFLYGNCALLCFSNKNLRFLVYLARLKLHRAIVQPRNRSENFTHWKWRMH